MPEPKRAPIEDLQVDDTKPTLEREAAPTIEIEMPTSKGELAEAPAQAVPPADAHGESTFARDLGPEIHGRAAGNDEARARLGRVNFDEATTERIGEMLGQAAENAEAQGIRDEIGDQEALRLAGHVDQPEMLAGPRVEMIPDFNRQNRDLVVPEVPVPPNMLPAVIQNLPAFVNDEITWMKMTQLPGYVVNHIRALGRSTFRVFPCFAEHERKERERGVTDPMSTLTILANFPGQGGPSEQRELDMMAQWIAEEGVLVETDVLEFPGAFPGYRPEVALLATANDSFLMVRDTIAGGAPVEGIYIYHWKGGAAAYQLANGRVDLGRLDAGPAAARPQLVAPVRRIGARAQPGPRAVGQIRNGMGRAQMNDRPQIRGQMEVVAPARAAPQVAPRLQPLVDPDTRQETDRAVRKKGLNKSIPVAASTTDAIAGAAELKRVRDLGFVPFSNAKGPAMKLEHEDGRTFLVSAQPGKRLIDTPSFQMRIISGSGEETLSETVTVDEIRNAIGPKAPSPR